MRATRASDERHCAVMNAALQRLDPRRHLAAAIGLAVATVTALAALLAANFAAATTEAQARSDAQRLLTQFATQVGHALGMAVQTRRAIVRSTATQIAASREHGDAALRQHLAAVRAQFPEYAWLAVADTQCHTVAATDRAREGQRANGWCSHGLMGPYIGARRGADPAAPDVDLSQPLLGADGAVVGVVGARLSWAFFAAQIHVLRDTLHTRRQPELWLIDAEGTVLQGPPEWRGRSFVPPTSEADAHRLHSALVPLEGDGGAGGLGWRVWMREPSSEALAGSQTRRWTVFGVVLLAGLLAAAGAALAARLLTRRLDVLATQAQAVREGRLTALPAPGGHDEVARIGAAMADLVGHLQAEREALRALNAELDARVAERTARIERLQEGERHAAVTRERLRLARELHDTLAHSLMALLTQIRLIRKLRASLPPEELDAELGRAQDVAASGLAEARAAITQMRHNSVREVGLGAALGELLARFRERQGHTVHWQADPAAAALADERAEAVFRIAEEALHNIERHAQARTVTVRLQATSAAAGPAAGVADAPGTEAAERIVLSLADDGVGFDPAAPRTGHYGLRGMQEQAALIGARLRIDSQPGAGTTLTLDFPV